MLTGQQFSTRRLATLLAVAALAFSTALPASAQDEQRPSVVTDVIKGVVFDPTTYAPALFSYDSTMRDWNTSQAFFRNGYMERNPRFTLTGLPNDHPVSYTVGKQQIVRDAVTVFGMSVVQNTTSRLVEHMLLSRYPEHRRTVKTIGWIQRIAVASLMSYHLSAAHYRQSSRNAAHALELGFQ